MGSRFHLIWLVSGLMAVGATITRADVFSAIQFEAHGTIAPIQQIQDDLQGPPLSDGQMIAYRHRATAGFSGSWGHFYVFHREASLFEFNKATAQVAYSLENETSLPVGNYPIQLNANRISGMGFGYGYRWDPSRTLSIQPRVAFLQADQVTHGSLTGQLTSDGNETTGDLALNYFYSRDSILDRTPEAVVGRGLTLDLAIQWHLMPQLTLDASFEDLASYIRWDQVTTTEADATTTLFELKNDQWRTFPAISGFAGRRDQTQEITRLTTLAFQWHRSEADDVILTPRWLGSHFLPEIGYRTRAGRNAYQVSLVGGEAAPSFTWHRESIALTIAMDALNFEDAKTARLVFSVQPDNML